MTEYAGHDWLPVSVFGLILFVIGWNAAKNWRKRRGIKQ